MSPYVRQSGTRRWRRRARLQLLHEPLCRRCLERGKNVAARVADHIIAHRGDINGFWLGPLQSLCFECHNSDKQSEEVKGHRHDIGADGWPIDPRHPVFHPEQRNHRPRRRVGNAGRKRSELPVQPADERLRRVGMWL